MFLGRLKNEGPSFFNTVSSFIFALSATALIGCGGPQNFRGTLSVHGLRGLQEMKDQPIQVEMKYDAYKWEALAHINNSQGQEILRPFTIKKVKSSHYDLVIPDVRWRTIHLEQIKDDPTCFVARNLYLTEFCHNEFSFNLTIKDKQTDDLKLKLFGAVSMPPPPVQEGSPGNPSEAEEAASVVFTVPEAIERMFKRNFDIQEGYQELVRAQKSATRNYLTLLPHPTLGSAIIAEISLTGNVSKVRKSLGDIVPFLFPGRWMKAKESSWEAKAEKVTYDIKKSNAILALQTHAILFNAHFDLMNELKALQTEIENSLLIAKKLHEDGYFKETSVLTLQSLLIDLQIRLRTVEAAYGYDQFELSKLLGFRRAMAVKQILLGKETQQAKNIPVLSAEAFGEELTRYTGLAEAGSFELPQLYFLWKAAQVNASSVYLNWFDLSGRDGFGLNLFPDRAIAQSLISSLEISQNTVRSTLNSKVSKHLLKRNTLIQNWLSSEKSLENLRKLLNHRFNGISDYRVSHPLKGEEDAHVSSNIRNAVGDTMGVLEDYYTLRAEVEIQQVELDHLALEGVYEMLIPHRKASQIDSQR